MTLENGVLQAVSEIKGLDHLAEKKIVDMYVHEIKAFPDKASVILKLDLDADKDGVGGGT